MTTDPPFKNLVLSVVTPTFNQSTFLRDTIESVLAQDYPHIDYRVIDDGSTDQTTQVLAEYDGRILWETQQNQGQTPTVNKGWSLAKGGVLTWLNSDDTFLPGAVSTAMQFLERNPDVGIVFGRTLYTSEDGTPVGPSPVPRPFDYAEFVAGGENPIPQPSAFIRRSVVETTGPLDDRHYYFMDWDYWLRAGLNCRIAAIPEVLSTYRLHAESKTVSHARRYAPDLLTTYREFFARGDLPMEIRRLKRWALANVCFTSAGYYRKGGDGASAARLGLEALAHDPSLMLSPPRLHKLAYCLFGGTTIYQRLRRLAPARGPPARRHCPGGRGGPVVSRESRLQVTLVVPVRNEERSLRRLVESIRAQTRPPDEVILVDGGSVDGTVAVAGALTAYDPRFRVIEAGDATPGCGRNVGIAAARFDWVALTDAGIRLEPMWLERLLDVAEADPAIEVVYGNYEPVARTFFERLRRTGLPRAKTRLSRGADTRAVHRIVAAEAVGLGDGRGLPEPPGGGRPDLHEGR